jgi:hypothetical protein
VAPHPGYLGLGIDEQTAVVVQGRVARVLGERQVHVCFSGQGTVKVFRSGERIDLDALPDRTQWQSATPGPLWRTDSPRTLLRPAVASGCGGQPGDPAATGDASGTEHPCLWGAKPLCAVESLT